MVKGDFGEIAVETLVEFCAPLILHFRDESDGRFTAGSVSFMHSADYAPSVERALGSRDISPVGCAAI